MAKDSYVGCNDRARHGRFQIVHANLTVRNVSLKTLIQAAYGIQGPLIAGGPAWLNSDRYDVVAKGPAAASKQQVWLMLQSLLADRFQLRLRRETREQPVYELQLGTGDAKLPKRDDGDCEVVPVPDRSSHVFVAPCGGVARAWGPQGGIMSGEKVPLRELASALSEVEPSRG